MWSGRNVICICEDKTTTQYNEENDYWNKQSQKYEVKYWPFSEIFDGLEEDILF